MQRLMNHFIAPVQHASPIYRARGDIDARTNQDIFQVIEADAGREAIHDAAPDVAVGSCQYSDRLISSPASCPGRNFAVISATLHSRRYGR